jgi:hypothetical protein
MYYAAAPSKNTMEYAPQGLFGDIIGGLAPTVGSLIGGAAGNQQLGSNIGNIAGQLGSLIPFQATPTAYGGMQPLTTAYGGMQPLTALAAAPQAYAPQGLFSSIVGGIAPTLGGLIGGAAGNQQLGQNIGNVAGELSKLIPFEAAPTAYGSMQPLAAAPQAYAPQGVIGGLLGGPLGGALGGALGGLLGNRSLGESIGSGIGGIGGGLLPFSVAPNPYANPYIGQIG